MGTKDPEDNEQVLEGNQHQEVEETVEPEQVVEREMVILVQVQGMFHKLKTQIAFGQYLLLHYHLKMMTANHDPLHPYDASTSCCKTIKKKQLLYLSKYQPNNAGHKIAVFTDKHISISVFMFFMSAAKDLKALMRIDRKNLNLDK